MQRRPSATIWIPTIILALSLPLLAAEPANGAARDGIRKVVSGLQAQAYAAIDARHFDEAEHLLAQASEIDPADAGQAPLQKAIAEARTNAGREAAMRASQAQAPVVTAQPETRQERRAEFREALREARAGESTAAPDALARLRIGGMLGSAHRALEDGDTATAVLRFEQVLRLDPGNREAREGLRQARSR